MKTFAAAAAVAVFACGTAVTDKAIVTMSLKGASGWQTTGWAWAGQ